MSGWLGVGSNSAAIGQAAADAQSAIAIERFSKNADATMLVSESNWDPSIVNFSEDAMSIRTAPLQLDSHPKAQPNGFGGSNDVDRIVTRCTFLRI